MDADNCERTDFFTMKRKRKQRLTGKRRSRDPHARREAARYEQPIASRELIIEVIAEAGSPLERESLAGMLEIGDDTGREALRRRLQAMVRDGQLVKNPLLVLPDDKLVNDGSSARFVAGGMENMSRAPYLLGDARWGLRMGNSDLVDAMVAHALPESAAAAEGAIPMTDPGPCSRSQAVRSEARALVLPDPAGPTSTSTTRRELPSCLRCAPFRAFRVQRTGIASLPCIGPVRGSRRPFVPCGPASVFRPLTGRLARS